MIGVLNIADAVLLHKWVLKIPDVKLADWKAGDVMEDGKLNGSDLTVMKQMLIGF